MPPDNWLEYFRRVAGISYDSNLRKSTFSWRGVRWADLILNQRISWVFRHPSAITPPLTDYLDVLGCLKTQDMCRFNLKSAQLTPPLETGQMCWIIVKFTLCGLGP